MQSSEMKHLILNFVSILYLSSYIKDRVSDEIEAGLKKVPFDLFRDALQAGNKVLGDEDGIQQLYASLKEASKPENVKRMLLEMALCRYVEAVDFYLAQMLRKVYTQRPEILRARDFTVQISEVLQCGTIDEVIFRVAEKKIQELSYKGCNYSGPQATDKG